MPFTINYEHYTAHLCKYGLDSESFPHISFSIALCMLTWPLCSFSFQYISPHIKANSVNIYLDRVRTAYVIESWCVRTSFFTIIKHFEHFMQFFCLIHSISSFFVHVYCGFEAQKAKHFFSYYFFLFKFKLHLQCNICLVTTQKCIRYSV